MSSSQNQGADVIKRYGSYAVGFLGALGALVGALLMPASASTLIGAAGTLAVITFLFSSEHKPFGLRLLGMLGAGVTLLFAFLMPEHAPTLLSGAGTIAVLSLLFA